jgi:hypothetical protein
MVIVFHAPLRQRATMLSLIAALILTGLPASATPTDHYSRAVIGQWRLTAALDGADITSLDEKEARQLVGRVFSISKQSVKFGDRTCGPSEFEAESVEPRLFLREQFHADAAALHLPSPVTVVDLSCTSVFIKSTDRLVIAWKGWFFDAVRVRRQSRP